MRGQVITQAILLLTVFLWTVQPAALCTVAVVDTCSFELDNEVELGQSDVKYLLHGLAKVAICLFSTALPADDSAPAIEEHVRLHHHLRGPPLASPMSNNG
jgi:hypothetical protein